MDLRQHLPAAGKFILDAGCGAIPHEEYLDYHRGYEKRICLDFSIAALREARQRLGDKGVYIACDLTCLPFKTGSIDAAVACHSYYHVPTTQQPDAFRELGRVISTNATAVVIYSWAKAPLNGLLRNLLKLLSAFSRPTPEQSDTNDNAPPLPFFPQTRVWFEDQHWPFRYVYRAFRPISGDTLRLYFRDNAFWRLVANTLLGLQRLMPGFFGRHGKHPAIVIHGNPGMKDLP